MIPIDGVIRTACFVCRKVGKRMSDFLKEMQMHSDEFKKTKNIGIRACKYSNEQLERYKSEAEAYIQSLVKSAKERIKDEAKAGKVCTNKWEKERIFLKDKVVEGESYYLSYLSINYKFDFSEPIFKLGKLEYIGVYDQPYYEDGYIVSDYRIIAYIVKEVVSRLKKEKIFVLRKNPYSSNHFTDNTIIKEQLKIVKENYDDKRTSPKQVRFDIGFML